MRNLKKLLALTLAMVMAFSLMLTANAVKYDDYGDKADIPAEFVEAVKVLTGLKVMQGDEKGFRPGASITRAEAAAIIYRVATGDVEDKQVNIYADYGTFTDVNKGDWFAGYVGYCQNAGYIKGTSPTTFNPYGQVTGYEALAMILRVVGYGKNNEFTGAEWQVNVAALSKQLQVTKNVVNANFETTLNYSARRDVVADLVFQTMATVPTVTYTPALAYNDKQSIAGTTADWFNPTLGQKIFGLHPSDGWVDIDDWGRPGYYWYSEGTWDGKTVTGAGVNAYVISANHPVYTGGGSIATIDLEPSAKYDKQVRECDVASDLKISNRYDFARLYVNGTSSTDPSGVVPVSRNYRIVATDTVTKVGGQGRVTEFYYKQTSPWFDYVTSDVVMIDTMLAKVTAKTDAKLDPAGHVMVPARLEVTIWDGPNAGASEAANIVSKRIITKTATDSSNWEYNKGDFILLNAYTNKTARLTNEEKEAAAFETNKVVGSDTTDNVLTNKKVVWVQGVAESFQGKQTLAYWNNNKHQVDKKDYNDQLCLFLDKAGNNTNTTYTWFLDKLGNLIGIGDAKSTNYGVITSIYAAFGQGETDTTGKVKAVANVKYADGTTGQVTIDKFLMSCGVENTLNDNGIVSNTAGGASAYNNKENTKLTDSQWTVELWPVYDTANNGPMTVGKINPLPTSKPADAANGAWLYLAPSASSNTQAHNFTVTNDTYGILYNHMFEFTTASDNSVTAVEVAGVLSTTAGASNTGMYVDNANNQVAANKTGKVFKNLGFLTLDNTTAATAAADVWLNNNTQIIVRDGTTLTTYNGVSALPGDITLAEDTEVDWADTDGDGRADYLYVEGKIPGVVTYGLFYFNGGGAQWDGTKGTLAGYLNGDEATVTFDDYTEYTTVLNSANYDGHLFALQITNGVVSDVMIKTDTNTTPYLLEKYEAINTTAPANYPTAGFYNVSGEIVVMDASASNDKADKIGLSTAFGTKFLLGSKNGNSYTYNTALAYYRDSLRDDDAANVNDRHTNLTYVYESGGYKIKVSGYDFAAGALVASAQSEYWIAPNAKIHGELEWLNTRENDVTIVFENNAANAIIEIYITPDPDITPVPGTGPAAPANAATSAVLSSTVVGVNNDAALISALTSSAPNTVLFPTFTGNVSIGGMGDNTHLDVNGGPGNKLLFFPYSVSGTADTRLVIRNAETGALVYAESGTVSNNGLDGAATGAAHAYVIDFTRGAAGNPSGTCYDMPLKAGYTYSFSITTTTATRENTLSSGTFTMQ